MIILGIHGGPSGSHGTGACLLDDGKLIYAIEEERLIRYKHATSCFPEEALKAIFKKTGVNQKTIDLIAFTGITYEDMKVRWPSYMDHRFGIQSEFFPVNHQVSHSANAFYFSPFDRALVISLDGVGDRMSGLVSIWEGANYKEIKQFSNKQSIGFFWHILTQYIGFEPIDESWKVMGLAPFGEPKYDLSDILRIENGDIFFDDKYLFPKYKFNNYSPYERWFTEKLISFLPFSPRKILEKLRPCDRDIAASMQRHLEQSLSSLFSFYIKETQMKNLCFGGGVALNSKANGYLSKILDINNMYVSPASADNGLAVGAACFAYSQKTGKRPKQIHTPYLGIEYSESEIMETVRNSGLAYKENVTFEQISEILLQDKVLGLYQGPSEYGPRALGNRSIISSPCKVEMRDNVNRKIKYREEYRPFAPVITKEFADVYFDLGKGLYNHMSFCVKAKQITKEKAPAIVHADGTSRVQVVTVENNPFLYNLVLAFYKKSGVPILLNTSFNLRGEPIVETPRDAIRTFVASGLDYLVMGSLLITKNISNENL